MNHEYMPISVSMTGRRCLVVGGGPVALRKVENLIDYDAEVTVVAPRVHAALADYAKEGRITLEARDYRSPEAADYGLVVSAADDRALNQRVYDDATTCGVLVNVVDDPPRCDFIVPAVLRRDCLTVAITTDGKAPFMSGYLRLILDDVFPRHWERLMRLAAAFRTRVRDRWPGEPEERARCHAEFLRADWKTMFDELSDDAIEEKLSEILEHRAPVGEQR